LTPLLPSAISTGDFDRLVDAILSSGVPADRFERASQSTLFVTLLHFKWRYEAKTNSPISAAADIEHLYRRNGFITVDEMPELLEHETDAKALAELQRYFDGNKSQVNRAWLKAGLKSEGS